jgi:lactoylglutathione lyase
MSPTSPIVRQPDHIGVRVRDLDAALAFYREVLGLPEVERLAMQNGTTLVMLQLGSTGYVELVHRADFSAAVPVPANQAGLQHFCLEIDDLEAWVGHLKQHGVSLASGPFDMRWPSGPVRGLFIADPEGNAVELLQRNV